jgi:hypothetical protein
MLHGPEPRPGAKPAAAMPKLTPAPPISAAAMVSQSRTSSTEAAPIPGPSGCEAPAKP